jgi:glutamate dehydrogenase (NAD(P)+)
LAVTVGGVGLGELVGGCGVAEAALAGIERFGLADPRAFVQGFGSMGGAAARFLTQAGVPVVGLADAWGVVANPDGLDIEHLLRTRDPLGRIDRDELRPGDVELPRQAWLDVEASVLVPAAISYAVDDAREVVHAKLIVEAANMPVTARAEQGLVERGVVVIPDVAANSATNSWWWWTLFGDIEADADQAFTTVRIRMRRLVNTILDEAEAAGVTPRAAAAGLAEAASLRISQEVCRH